MQNSAPICNNGGDQIGSGLDSVNELVAQDCLGHEARQTEDGLTGGLSNWVVVMDKESDDSDKETDLATEMATTSLEEYSSCTENSGTSSCLQYGHTASDGSYTSTGTTKLCESSSMLVNVDSDNMSDISFEVTSFTDDEESEQADPKDDKVPEKKMPIMEIYEEDKSKTETLSVNNENVPQTVKEAIFGCLKSVEVDFASQLDSPETANLMESVNDDTLNKTEEEKASRHECHFNSVYPPQGGMVFTGFQPSYPVGFYPRQNDENKPPEGYENAVRMFAKPPMQRKPLEQIQGQYYPTDGSMYPANPIYPARYYSTGDYNEAYNNYWYNYWTYASQAAWANQYNAATAGHQTGDNGNGSQGPYYAHSPSSQFCGDHTQSRDIGSEQSDRRLSLADKSSFGARASSGQMASSKMDYQKYEVNQYSYQFNLNLNQNQNRRKFVPHPNGQSFDRQPPMAAKPKRFNSNNKEHPPKYRNNNNNDQTISSSSPKPQMNKDNKVESSVCATANASTSISDEGPQPTPYVRKWMALNGADKNLVQDSGDQSGAKVASRQNDQQQGCYPSTGYRPSGTRVGPRLDRSSSPFNEYGYGPRGGGGGASPRFNYRSGSNGQRPPR